MGEKLHTRGADHEAPSTIDVRPVESAASSIFAPVSSGRAVARLLATADATTRARVVTGLQRTHGNAAVARFFASAASPPRRQPPSTRVLARYSHEDCTDDFLQSHVWPADHLARQMTVKAYAFVSDNPIRPEVIALFKDYFNTKTPDLELLKSTFRTIHEFFQADDYKYECEDECPPAEGGREKLAYVLRPYALSDIHLCVPSQKSGSQLGLGRDILHELMHKLFGWADKEYCLDVGCPDGLSAEDASTNPDSYANFALAAYDLKRHGDEWKQAK